MLLSGKVAIVTGGSKGLGKALCLAFAKKGAAVVTCARESEKLKEVESEMSRLTDSSVVLQADVSKIEDVRRLVSECVSRFRRVDILVNNASVLGPRVELLDYPEEIWRSVLETNLYGPFLLSKEVARLMIRQRSGSIINVSSSVGRAGRARWGAYAVSKFGLEGLTQVMADELKQYNIRVNSVNPGAMATDMRREAYPEEDQTKLKRPEDILDVFFYLASDESIGHTGGMYDAQNFIRHR